MDVRQSSKKSIVRLGLFLRPLTAGHAPAKVPTSNGEARRTERDSSRIKRTKTHSSASGESHDIHRLVESYREGSVVKQRLLINLGSA